MAKKHRKPIVPAVSRQPLAPVGAAGMLQEALRLLRRGEYPMAQEQATYALKYTSDRQLAAVAREVLAEVHFRAAVTSDEPSAQLEHLDAALQQTPAAPKLHFYRGLNLLQQGRPAESLTDLDAAAKREPDRRGLAFLRALARVATGQPWDASGLAPAEANTLRLVQQLTRRGPAAAAASLDDPLLGKGVELWQALAAMCTDPTAAPAGELKLAAERNMRKPVSRILHYYRGVAAFRAGDRATARESWLRAQSAGFASPSLTENLAALVRAESLAQAQAGRWQDLVQGIGRLPAPIVAADRILAETGSLAHYHLGYDAAQAGHWARAAQHWRSANDLAANRYLAQNLALAEEALENWRNAAEAWREMVRRRPRSAGHPDYLTDAQVAALWNHAADCYQHTELVGEVETCLRNAVKYAPEDVSLRLRLAEVLIVQDRGDAAETQLQEILAREPQNVEALVRLGRIYEGLWNRDPLTIWRRVLAIDPAQREAREALADYYLEIASDESPFALWRFDFGQPGTSPIQTLEAGLQELPGHPKVLAALGIAHRRQERFEQARAYLMQAFQAAPLDASNVGVVLHELLHAQAADAVEELMPAVRQIPRLLPAFWLDQADTALHCKFDERWANSFVEEAVQLSAEPWVEDTRAGVLVEAYEKAHAERAKAVCAALAKRIRDEVPNSGAVQYIEAHDRAVQKNDLRGALRLLRDAIRTARRANDSGVLRRAEFMELQLRSATLGIGPGFGPGDLFDFGL